MMITRGFIRLRRPTRLSFNILKRSIARDREIDEHPEKGSWRDYKVETELERGIDLIRGDGEEEKCLFPTISQLGVTTENRKHNFQANCDDLIKFIKLGAINKNIAIQYCHYLAHLTRTCDASDKDYFGKRCLNLFTYLTRNSRDLTFKAQVELLIDVSDSTEQNCIEACNLTLHQEEFTENFSTKYFTKLLSSCYKFELWQQANAILSKYYNAEVVSPWLFDHLITALPKSIESYNNLGEDSEERKKLKNDITEHLLKICEFAHRDRIQFITKYAGEFTKSLEQLGAKVVKNPTIKLSGRCVNCNSFIPTYEEKTTTNLNKSIRDVLYNRLMDKYYIHTSPRDLENFENFLTHIHKIDKKPIDLVIDGLNIAYKNTLGIYYIKQAVTEDFEVSRRRHNPRSQVQVLVNTIIRGNMLQNFKKILVIGREHMKKWPGLMDFLEEQKIYHYFSLNHSKDDLFQLYAATFNPKTLLVTGDFLRDHLALFKHDDRIMFERWVDTHQVWIQQKTLKPIWPTPFEKVPSAQPETGHIHVPIIDFHKLATIADHEPPPHLNSKMTTWTCCKLHGD